MRKHRAPPQCLVGILLALLLSVELHVRRRASAQRFLCLHSKMSGGGKDLSAQLYRQLAQAPNQSDEGAPEETTTSASAGENSQSPMKLKEVGDDASADTNEACSRYLFVSFFGGDGTEFKLDLTKTIDAGAVGRIPSEPARDVLDRNNSAHQADEVTEPATTCNGNAAVDSVTKPKRRHPKLVESGPAEHIGLDWTYKTYQRMNGATEGQTDTYWFSPLLQKRFRSRKEIDRFLEFHRQAQEMLTKEAGGQYYKINSMQCESIAWDQFKKASSTPTGVRDKEERNEDKVRPDKYPVTSHKSWAQSAIEAAGDAEKTNSHPWTRRIRAKLKEMKYEGDADAMVRSLALWLNAPQIPG